MDEFEKIIIALAIYGEKIERSIDPIPVVEVLSANQLIDRAIHIIKFYHDHSVLPCAEFKDRMETLMLLKLVYAVKDKDYSLDSVTVREKTHEAT